MVNQIPHESVILGFRPVSCNNSPFHCNSSLLDNPVVCLYSKNPNSKIFARIVRDLMSCSPLDVAAGFSELAVIVKNLWLQNGLQQCPVTFRHSLFNISFIGSEGSPSWQTTGSLQRQTSWVLCNDSKRHFY